MSEAYVNTFRIGGDPEFSMINPNGTVHIARSTSNPEIGIDHGGSVIELRPKPAYSVKGFLNNIKKLLDDPVMDVHRERKWRSGAYLDGIRGDSGYNAQHDMSIAMGGHIHLEVPYQHDLRGASIPPVDMGIYNKRVEALNHFTKMMEEINFLPKDECAKRRDVAGYGRFEGYDFIHPVKAYEQQRIEYRSPCSWLFNPRNAMIVITGLKLATVSPVNLLKTVQPGSPDKIYAGVMKLFRNYQNIDHDAFLVANHILRSSNPDNMERLKAVTDIDFKQTWNSKGVKPLEAPARA